MHTTNAILIQAPRETIFETVTDLQSWPRLLPHYRYIQVLERRSDGEIVKMAARRSGIPVSWVSRFVADRERMELRFVHLRAFTRGMEVIWTLTETPAGVLVEITHTLRFRVPALAPIAEPFIGRFFIEHIANKTLCAFKAHFEDASADRPFALPNEQRTASR